MVILSCLMRGEIAREEMYLEMFWAVTSSGENRAASGIWSRDNRDAVNTLPYAKQAHHKDSSLDHSAKWVRSSESSRLIKARFCETWELGRCDNFPE